MKRPEQLIQQGVFSNLIPLMHLQKYSQFVAFQIRNETGMAGGKGAVLGAIAKSMGTMSGVYDTAFLFPTRKRQEIVSRETLCKREYCHFGEVEIPPKIVFVEFKAMKPLKTKEREPESLLSPEQATFKARIEALGFEYKIVAAADVNDALKQIYAILRDNGVTV